jgi:hypothetical protein
MGTRSHLLRDFASRYIWWRDEAPPSEDRIIHSPAEGAVRSGPDRAVLAWLVTAKLAVYETMRGRG